MTEIQKKGEELRAKRAQLREIAQKCKLDTATDADYADLEAKSQEVSDLQDKYEAMVRADQINQENERQMKRMDEPVQGRSQSHGANGRESKTLGEMFTDSTQFKNWDRTGVVSSDITNVSLKTLLTTISGYPPESMRNGRVAELPKQRPTIASLIPSVNTNQNSIKYMEETVYDNQTDAVLEGDALAESGLAFVERSIPIEKIGTFIPVTDEQLEDVAQVQGIINNRLLLMLQQREDVLLLNGTGISPQIQGFLTKPGILNQPLGADTSIDAIHKAIERVESANGFANNVATVSAIVMHPITYGVIQRMKDGDGRYLIGDPVTGADGSRLWGVPVIKTTAIGLTDALLGDFQMFSQIDRRTGMTIEAGYINDQFIRGQQSIKITERIALEILRANAFCRVTGL